MSDITVSPTVDAFMAATTPAEARAAIGAGAKLLCEVTDSDPSAITLLQFVEVIFNFPNVTQSEEIYDPLTGVFTITEPGVYMLYFGAAAQITDWLSGYCVVAVNGVIPFFIPVSVPFDAVIFNGVIPLNLQAGDTVDVRSMINRTSGDPAPLMSGAKMALFKL